MEADNNYTEYSEEKHNQELTICVLMDLHMEKQHGTLGERSSKEEETEEGVLSSIDITEICKIWETVQSFVKKTSPQQRSFGQFMNLLQQNVMTHLKKIFKA